MFGKYQYDRVPQSNHDLCVSAGYTGQSQYVRGGNSFDYVPNVNNNDYTDRSQGWLSWICNLIVTFLVWLCVVITFPVSGWFVLKAVPNYQRIVVFRLGRVTPPKGPGTILILPLIDQWQKVDLRTRAFNIPPCKVATGDGGLVSVGADIQFRIWSPVMSVMAVQDLNASTRLTAQNTMTHSLGKRTIREIQAERVKLGEILGMDINETTRQWGLEVDRVELTLESVLSGPKDASSGPVILPPMVPGLEALTGPIQKLAMHFLESHAAVSEPHVTGESVRWIDEQTPGDPEAVRRTSVEELLSAVELLLSERLVTSVGACFQFHIQLCDGQNKSYYVDLSQGSGQVGTGEPSGEPDVTLHLSEKDLLAMFEGSLRPFRAYTSGSLKVQGDLKTALKLEELIKLMRQ